MEILLQDEVQERGIEFEGDVCYSGEYGQQVYTKEMEDGGIPVEGIVYEKYPNGSLNYYCYYTNGIPNGEYVKFYESGKIKSYCKMDTGTIDGNHIEWYENGNIKKEEVCKYGFVLTMQEYSQDGKIIKEKKELTEDEKTIYERRVAYYNAKNNG